MRLITSFGELEGIKEGGIEPESGSEERFSMRDFRCEWFFVVGGIVSGERSTIEWIIRILLESAHFRSREALLTASEPEGH